MEKIKCRVCGFEWTPTKEDHYIAKEDAKATVFVKYPGEPALYDAWDCPVCGAQFAVEGRKRTAEETAEGPVGITVAFGGGYAGNGGSGELYDECKNCKYVDLDGDDYPCNECSRNYYDKYREEKKNGAE